MHTGFVAPAGLAHSVQKSTVVSILHCTCKEPARAAEGLAPGPESLSTPIPPVCNPATLLRHRALWNCGYVK